MKEVKFIPKNNVQDYLYNKHNVELYRNIVKDDFWFNKIKTIDYFNLLFEQVEIIKANKDKPISIIEHLNTINTDEYIIYAVIYGIFYYLNIDAYCMSSNKDELFC